MNGGDGGESNSPSRTESPGTSYKHFRPTCASRCRPPTGGVLHALSGAASRLFDVAHRSRRRRIFPCDVSMAREEKAMSTLVAT